MPKSSLQVLNQEQTVVQCFICINIFYREFLNTCRQKYTLFLKDRFFAGIIQLNKDVTKILKTGDKLKKPNKFDV